MPAAVELEDELSFHATKVCDEWADHELAAELRAAKAAVAQKIPELSFSVGGIKSQAPRIRPRGVGQGTMMGTATGHRMSAAFGYALLAHEGSPPPQFAPSPQESFVRSRMRTPTLSVPSPPGRGRSAALRGARVRAPGLRRIRSMRRFRQVRSPSPGSHCRARRPLPGGEARKTAGAARGTVCALVLARTRGVSIIKARGARRGKGRGQGGHG